MRVFRVPARLTAAEPQAHGSALITRPHWDHGGSASHGLRIRHAYPTLEHELPAKLERARGNGLLLSYIDRCARSLPVDVHLAASLGLFIGDDQVLSR
jgi:hypothetical protein